MELFKKLFGKDSKNFAEFTVRIYNVNKLQLDNATLTVVIRRLNRTPGYIPGPWQDLVTVPVSSRKLFPRYIQVKIPVPTDTLTPFGEYRLRLNGYDYEAVLRDDSPNGFDEFWDGGLTDKQIYFELYE